MTRLLTIFLTLFSPVFAALADSPARPFPYVTTSENGRMLFKMIPLQFTETGTKPAFGVAIKLMPDGSFKELWRLENNYSFQTFISNNGENLIVMGPWNQGHTPSPDHLALAFYKNGKLIKSYSTAELVKDPSKVKATVSHYFWRADSHEECPDAAGINTRISWDNLFTLTTVDCVNYTFNVINGEILSEKN
ncbi:hypothetical protein [Aliikangiella sp. G2MR2-5]|uniref:hypothetical protein n=1 Tax=Aliikangiella sp. G2MR2-5 TaxID=2788943 RepID=UPI0018ABE830|nr:hypothetical protein [Aliikangiella sp. G2MR2-5]